MSLIARLLYAAAVVLVIVMVLALLKVIVIGTGWVALLVAAIVCAVIAYFIDGSPHGRARL